jgi:hypothetical protein
MRLLNCFLWVLLWSSLMNVEAMHIHKPFVWILYTSSWHMVCMYVARGHIAVIECELLCPAVGGLSLWYRVGLQPLEMCLQRPYYVYTISSFRTLPSRYHDLHTVYTQEYWTGLLHGNFQYWTFTNYQLCTCRQSGFSMLEGMQILLVHVQLI